jgi:hypothetical protein
MKLKKITIPQCDNCGKLWPKTFPNGRLTKCCSTYDIEHPNAFYGTQDEKGVKVFSIGKVRRAVLTFPIGIFWRGFFN